MTGELPVSLAAQQEWFARAVMTPASEDQPAGAPEAPLVLTPGPDLDALGRLEIYRHAYSARLVECLLDDYPTVSAALGEAAFEALCRRYVARHPSTSPNLNAFGRHMADLAKGEAFSVPATFVSDLAALEWAIVEVIHASSLEPLDPAALGAIPPDCWGDATLVPTPALRLLRTAYPVNAYFQATREERHPSVPDARESFVAVCRSGPTVWRVDLSAASFDLLHALSAGRPLGASLDEACGALSGVDESEAAERVTGWFRDWVSSGLFSGVQLGSTGAPAPSR
jgi:hypothetical protein